MADLDDTKPAAVLVITAITPGETKISGSPSTILKLYPEDVAAIEATYGPQRNLLGWINATIDLALHQLPRPAVEPVSTLNQVLDERFAAVDEEADKHTLGDENTPADHYFRS